MGYNPRHACQVGRKHLTWKTATAGGGSLAAIGTGLALALSGAAGASVSPTTTYTNNGVAGYYETPNATRTANGDHVTGARDQFYLRISAESVQVAQGVELCQFKSFGAAGDKAVIYTQWNGTSYDVIAGISTSDTCLSSVNSGLLSSWTIDQIPAGHTVFLAITQSATTGVVTFTDSDQTTLTGANTSYSGFSSVDFNRSGFGANGNQSNLTAPATTKLLHVSGAATRDESGWAAINRAGLTRLVLNEVVDTSDGTGAGDVLLTPANLGTDSFNLFRGALSGV